MPRKPVLIVYPGYANKTSMIVMGHLLRKAPKRWFSESAVWWENIITMILLFRVKSISEEKIQLLFYGNEFYTQTDTNGFFHFEVNHLQDDLPIGYHPLEVRWVGAERNIEKKDEVLATGSLIRPSLTYNGIITDVDDTLMISHSQSLIRKIFTLLTKTPQQRRVFNDVVSHYALLTRSLKEYSEGFSFLAYLSSSEWNLYPFIREFCRINQLPAGVYLLRTLKKGLVDLLKAGRGSHRHKMYKIEKLIRFYPEMSFVLMGDDRQKDPEIYGHIARLFPKHIACIYIRNSGHKKRKRVSKLLTELNHLGIPYFYYRNSKEAISHSEEIGLIE